MSRGSGRTYRMLEDVLAHALGHLPKVIVVVGHSKEFATGYLRNEFAKVCQNSEVPFDTLLDDIHIESTAIRFKGQEETLRGYENIFRDHEVTL